MGRAPRSTLGLTRDSRKQSTAVAESSALTALRSVGLLDVLYKYDCGDLGHDALPGRRLHHFVTISCEKRGLSHGVAARLKESRSAGRPVQSPGRESWGIGQAKHPSPVGRYESPRNPAFPIWETRNRDPGFETILALRILRGEIGVLKHKCYLCPDCTASTSANCDIRRLTRDESQVDNQHEGGYS